MKEVIETREKGLTTAKQLAARYRYDLDVRYFANGFRVVRDVQ